MRLMEKGVCDVDGVGEMDDDNDGGCDDGGNDDDDDVGKMVQKM